MGTETLKPEGVWGLLDEDRAVCDKTREVRRESLCCTILTIVRNLDFIPNPMERH